MLDISKLRLTQPSLAGSWAELGNNAIKSGHYVYACSPKATDALHSNQFSALKSKKPTTMAGSQLPKLTRCPVEKVDLMIISI